MKMQFTYGIFDNEADHIIAMVRDHASLAAVESTPCPACGANMLVSFNEDATGFQLSCAGDPIHMTTYQEIDKPPPWWQECYEQPNDITWYWREWHSYNHNGTLHMKISGWQANGLRWSGELECSRDHQDYDLWRWILEESECTKDLISDTDLDELRIQYKQSGFQQ